MMIAEESLFYTSQQALKPRYKVVLTNIMEQQINWSKHLSFYLLFHLSSASLIQFPQGGVTVMIFL